VATHTDVLVVGIGSWQAPESRLYAAFPPAWHDQALAAGARVDLCATFLDDEGRAVANPLNQLALGIAAEQLRRIPDKVGIGGGLEKAAAIAPVLRGSWMSALVTDAGVARRLLAYDRPQLQETFEARTIC
jgi:DNA-binding transcriptional regulator LsrR (DeoR family)